MACTTILVGKRASYDGSTIVARNEDSPGGTFCPKRFTVVQPEEQPRRYRSVISHVELDLPNGPMRYTSMPNALGSEGIWGEAGFNEANVGMSATETLTANPRVLGADPLVALKPAKGSPGKEGYEPEVPGGIGEEDMLTIVLPYIRSAREGVLRLGALLEEHGTYEMNGIAFSDIDEIWWLETVGGHHWIAKRVPDDAYVTMPNQLGIDSFDLDDAYGERYEHLCSQDLRAWMTEHHLDPRMDATSTTEGLPSGIFNPREAFGTRSERDHIYNTPRAWHMQRYLNPSQSWDGAGAECKPEDDDLPWAQVPERRVSIEDVKTVLSSHFEGTPFDPYDELGTPEQRRRYRPIGINRQSQLAVLQLRPYVHPDCCALQWVAYGSNAFNTLAPFYANVSRTPEYLSNTTAQVTTESFYWANRIVAALADAHFKDNVNTVDAYVETTMAQGHAAVAETDEQVRSLTGFPSPVDLQSRFARTTQLALKRLSLKNPRDRQVADELLSNARMQQYGDEVMNESNKRSSCETASNPANVRETLEAANEGVAAMLRHETDALLDKVLFTSSNLMRNSFRLSDH